MWSVLRITALRLKLLKQSELSLDLMLFFVPVLGNDAAGPCPVVKAVDSFSFIHHPVHQRSLEILQRCKDEKYSKLNDKSLLDVFILGIVVKKK